MALAQRVLRRITRWDCPFVVIEGWDENGDPRVRHVRVDINAVFERLRWAGALKGKTVEVKTCEEFSEDIQRIVFCLLYYMGFDPARDRGGPELSTANIFAGSALVRDIVHARHSNVDYVEEFPDAAMRHNPYYSYTPGAALRITGAREPS